MPVLEWLVSEGYPQAEIDALANVFFWIYDNFVTGTFNKVIVDSNKW